MLGMAEAVVVASMAVVVDFTAAASAGSMEADFTEAALVGSTGADFTAADFTAAGFMLAGSTMASGVSAVGSAAGLVGFTRRTGGVTGYPYYDCGYYPDYGNYYGQPY